MEKTTIELPATFAFKRAGQVVTVATGNWNAEIIAQLVMHGATQKIGDAAAGKDGADAMKAMDAVMVALANGDWGRTRGGAGEDPVMRYVRQILREKMSDATKAEYKALAQEDRDDFLDAKFAALADDVQARVKDAAEARKKIDDEAKAAAKKAAKGAEFTI